VRRNTNPSGDFYFIMETKEVWKQIKGFPSYEVSDLGRVKSLKFGKERILKPVNRLGGYLSVGICAEKFENQLIHRLVLAAFVENPENKPQVNHINGDKSDNRLCNLEWCTAKENNLHAIRTGLVGKNKNKSRNKCFSSIENPQNGTEVVEISDDKSRPIINKCKFQCYIIS